MKRPQLVLGLIWLMMFVAYFDRINITVAGPAIVKSLGLAPSAFGVVLAGLPFASHHTQHGCLSRAPNGQDLLRSHRPPGLFTRSARHPARQEEPAPDAGLARRRPSGGEIHFRRLPGPDRRHGAP